MISGQVQYIMIIVVSRLISPVPACPQRVLLGLSLCETKTALVATRLSQIQWLINPLADRLSSPSAMPTRWRSANAWSLTAPR